MENNLIEQQKKALYISSVMRSIFKEMKLDEKSINKSDYKTDEFKEGFSEAIRTLTIIIKDETEVDVLSDITHNV